MTIQRIAGASPAVGVEVSEAVPAGVRWRLISIRLDLTTDATVIGRQPLFVFDDGATVFYITDVNFTQTESLAIEYDLGVGIGLIGQQGPTRGVLISIPPIILLPGWRIITSTVNFQAGDDWSTPQILADVL